MSTTWDTLPTLTEITTAIQALKAHNIQAEFFENRKEVYERVLALIPRGAQVMTMTSETLRALGLPDAIDDGTDYRSVRKLLAGMDPKTQKQEMNKLGMAPEVAIGSIHAFTKDGHILIASNTGSQIPAHLYGAGKVILVAGAHKLVDTTAKGIQRIYEYSLPLESERAKKAYGVAGSAVNKLAIINHENEPDRIHFLILNEVIGF